MRLQDRHRSAASTAPATAVEAAPKEAGARGEGPVDAARAGRGAEDREETEGLGVAGGALFAKGETGGERDP